MTENTKELVEKYQNKKKDTEYLSQDYKANRAELKDEESLGFLQDCKENSDDLKDKKKQEED